MTSEVVYAIRDLDSDLFITRELYHFGLDYLGVNTRFFKTKKEADTFKKERDCKNELAWWLLEKVYNKDRWHIDCGLKEYQDARNSFPRLAVVPVNLECRDVF